MRDLSYGAQSVYQTRTSTTYRYRPVKYRAEKNLPCPVCGKKVRRARTFEATLSPFNTNPDGTPRSYAEAHAVLVEGSAEWKATPELHQKCEDSS
jgi:hypothetical protein